MACVLMQVDKGQGPVATVIVKRGTLQVGHVVVLGSQWGKVRAMKQAGGQVLKQAEPGQPVEVSGLRGGTYGRRSLYGSCQVSTYSNNHINQYIHPVCILGLRLHSFIHPVEMFSQ